ncbi:MAG: ATP-binding cassette domain-containing protein [Deltaproteobacteria bacterium]|nr:ATP-binding cassette domain-containing protein [Deltaproteobacteria bacterium]
MIEAESLNKYYGNFQALKDVNFKVEKGEIVGFLGPNGAGKTTTMRILTGFIPPGSGTVRVAGFDIQTQSIEVRRRIGYLPESVPLYQEMTVTTFLRFLATIRGMKGPRREDRIKEVIRACRLDEYSKTPIAKLSKGYRQLVGVAQAIIHEPEVLILDEPTIGIDPRQVVHIRRLIQELGRDHTIILSSHILPEVSLVCQRIIVMNHGRIVAVDRPENLSAGLGGVRHYEIEAAGSKEKILSRLKAVKGVIKIEVEDAGPTKRYLVESQPGLDIRDELSSAVKDGGFRLLGLKTREMSLEDIFLKLTSKEKE